MAPTVQPIGHLTTIMCCKCMNDANYFQLFLHVYDWLIRVNCMAAHTFTFLRWGKSCRVKLESVQSLSHFHTIVHISRGTCEIKEIYDYVCIIVYTYSTNVHYCVWMHAVTCILYAFMNMCVFLIWKDIGMSELVIGYCGWKWRNKRYAEEKP